MLTPNTIWLIARWLVGLTIGILLVRRFRTHIRAAIAFCFPMKQRMAPSFFDRIRNYTAIALAVLSIAVAVLLNLAYQRWFQNDQTPIARTATTIIVPKAPDPQPEPMLPAETVQPPVTVELSKSEVVPSTIVGKEAEQLPPPNPIPSTYAETIPQGNIYLQLGAFKTATNAQTLQRYWTERTRYPVYLATFPDATPYKVLLGPFPHWDAARQFRQQHQLSAFPRAASYYRSILF